MEEPKENADKVSWTAYGAPHCLLKWESRHKEDAESRRIQFNNVVIALTVMLLPLYAAVAQLAVQRTCNA